MSVITVENLRYRYPHTKELALDGLDFSVEKGEFIGIIGENGAGKSTLCQAFNGLVPGFFKGAYGGRVIIDGEGALFNFKIHFMNSQMSVHNIESRVQKKLFNPAVSTYTVLHSFKSRYIF